MARPLQRVLADELVIFSVTTYPEPLDSALHLMTKGSVMNSNADRPQLSNSLEMQ